MCTLDFADARSASAILPCVSLGSLYPRAEWSLHQLLQPVDRNTVKSLYIRPPRQLILDGVKVAARVGHQEVHHFPLHLTDHHLLPRSRELSELLESGREGT
jgi:hypothetical protein